MSVLNWLFFKCFSIVEEVFCLSLSFLCFLGWSGTNTLEPQNAHLLYLRVKHGFGVHISAVSLKFWQVSLWGFWPSPKKLMQMRVKQDWISKLFVWTFHWSLAAHDSPRSSGNSPMKTTQRKINSILAMKQCREPYTSRELDTCVPEMISKVILQHQFLSF